MQKFRLAGAVIAALLASPAALAAPAGVVKNGNNDGPGSLRAALESGASVIVIKGHVGTITITEPLVYSNELPLRIAGSGQLIDGTALNDPTAPLLSVMGGSDVAIRNLAFDAGDGYDFDNPGGGKGIFVDIPDDVTGTVTVDLTGVSVFGTGNHGIHVSDCSLGDDCGGGQGGGGDGSEASIDVRLVDVLVENSGWGKADADGVRVDERAGGDILFSAVNSVFTGVGADGVELDEGNDGDVFLDVRNNYFGENGAFCLGDDDLQEGDDCYDDGDPDVDDGFDVDEAGSGTIRGFLRSNDMIANFDEGFDFDEEDEGGFDVVFASNIAIGNEDEGVKLSEEGEGSIVASLRSHYTEANNGSKEGIEIEEEGGGEVHVTVMGSTFVDPEVEELKIEEDGDGGTLKVRGTDLIADLDPSIDEI